MVPNNSAQPEFVAIVLASSVGTRLFPLTSPECPKHSLPIVGQPLLERLLHQLHIAGFVRAIVAVNEEEDIQKTFASGLEVSHDEGTFRIGETNTAMEIAIVRLATDCPSNVEALRIAMEQVPVTSHMVVFPGDLVVTDATVLKDLVHLHRQSNLTMERYQQHSSNHTATAPTACTMLLTNVGEVSEQGIPLKESAKQKKGLLSRDDEDIDYILRDNTSSRVLWKQAKIDVEEDKDGVGATPKLELPKSRLLSNCTLRMDWSDVHCYCFAPWVRTLLQARENLLSIQNDLIPLLVSRQFRGVEATFGSHTADQTLLDEALTMMKSPIDAKSAATTYTVLAHVSPNAATAFRANTVASYLYANKVEQGRAVPPGASYNAKFHSITMPDCTIGDKVTFKTTVIGKNCRLGNKCRLNNVVLMDDCTVGNNTILQNTIVGANCEIGDNCNLNDCQVVGGSKIPDGTKKKAEAFMEGDFA